MPKTSVAYYKFKQELTPQQFDYLLDYEESEGYGVAQMIINEEGVHYLSGEEAYNPQTIEEYFGSLVDQVLSMDFDNDEEDDE